MTDSRGVHLVSPVLLAAALIAAAAAPASADRGACALELERRGAALVFDLQLELDRQNALSGDEFGRIRAAAVALRSLGDAPDARRCLERPAAAARYQRWERRHATPMLQHADRRLSRVCTRRTRELVSIARLKIDRAVADRRFAAAARHADALELSLRQSDAVRQCDATADEVRALLEDFIPSVRAHAAIPEVSAKLTVGYHAARRTWEAAEMALQTAGRATELAPVELERPEGRARYREALERCVAYAGALRELGAAPDHRLDDPHRAGEWVTVDEAAATCRELQAGADRLFGRVIQHNTEQRLFETARWVRVSLKGWDMEVAYRERGRPIAETRRGGQHLWTFRSGADDDRCLELRFSSRGKELGRRAVPCPDAE